MPDNEPIVATSDRLESARQAIAGEVRAEMARKRKSLRDVAGVIGVSHESVRQRLNGEVSFRSDELVLLADELGVPAAQFVSQATDATSVGAA